MKPKMEKDIDVYNISIVKYSIFIELMRTMVVIKNKLC